MRAFVTSLSRAVSTRARRRLVGLTLGLGLLVGVAVGLVPADHTFATRTGVIALLTSVTVPFLGVLMASDVRRAPQTVRPLPTLVAAVLVAVAFGLVAALVGVVTVGVLGSDAGRWQDAVAVSLGAVVTMVMAQLVGVGLGLLIGRPWLACVATIVLPLGLWLGLGAIPAVSAAQAWVVPMTSAQHLLSGRMSGEAWAQLAVVLVLWGRCLYALGTWRLGRRGELVLV
ncbi:MAG TPA: hypothetical protein VEQ83_10425 [Lapillicoccus sp.]|nr:hypothetical protein [Lapillicoccus sp.]